MSKYLILISLLFSQNLLANQKLLYVLGGGGDPAGSDTIFDNDLKNVGKFVKKSDWQTVVSFDGGHSTTEKIIKDSFPLDVPKSNFVRKKYDDILTDLKNKLISGELKSGDQLMLMLNTHGAKKNEGELSHSVAFAGNVAKDLNNLRGADSFSLDTLKPIIEMAKEKGVKLALIDQSCHSGSTIDIAGPDSCVITAAGADHFGYSGTGSFLGFTFASTFSGKFNKLMAPGKNLEDIFVEARTEGSAPDFPMISTKEGKVIQDLLYKLSTPYMYYNDDKSSKFDSMYSAANIDEVSCKMENNYKELQSLISLLEGMKKIPLTTDDFEDLKKSFADYRDYQIKYEEAYKGLKGISEEIKNIIAKDYPKESHLFTESDGLSILNVDYAPAEQFYQSLHDSTTNEVGKKIWAKALDEIKLKKKIAVDIKKKLPKDSLDKIAFQEKMYKDSSVTEKYADAVSSNLKKAYKALYEGIKKKDQPNPCRDFVL